MKRCFASLLVAACGPPIDALGAATSAGTSGTSGTTIDSATTSATTSGSDSTSSSSTTTGVETGAAEDTMDRPFILDPDGGGPAIECDSWAQDCPRGEKCMPWANDGGGAWNAARCSPIDPDPKDVGEPCTVVGSAVSGIDDCVLGAMCWDVDPDTNMGECVGFCQGSEANPTCEDPCSSCALTGNGVLILCLTPCDPIAQDCSVGNACYPVTDTFSCGPDLSGEQGVVGDPCEFVNVCDPGSFCATADAVPGCEGASGCCAPFCDASAVDVCDALLPGTSCVPWVEDGQVPDGCTGIGIVGACVVPP